MSRRSLSLLLVSLVTAAICVRLGFWQLSRLDQRRAHNAGVATRLRESPATVDALPADTALRHYRRVAVAGVADYAHEIVLVNRSRDGSPGVHIVTPVRVAGRDTAVLVNRGWVYSGNGTDVALARWREGDSVAVDGYVELPSSRPGPARLGAEREVRAYRWLDPAAVSRELGFPVTPYYVVWTPPPGEAKPPQDRPVRVPVPALDEGSHMSYAVQWFSFATVALVGGIAFVRADGRRAPRPV
ncbi:MAG: SURF1 family protein [Gemmatirosa sp.]